MATTIRTVGYPDVLENVPPAIMGSDLLLTFYGEGWIGRALRATNCVGVLEWGGPYAYESGIDNVYLNTGSPVVLFAPISGTEGELSFGSSTDGGPGYFSVDLEIEDAPFSGVFIPLHSSGLDYRADGGSYIEMVEGDGPHGSECFWAPESVVGLSKVCTAAAPGGESPWAYITLPPEDWTPRPGGTYQTLGFPLEGALAGVTTATLTGVKVARAYTNSEEDDNDTGVMVSSNDDPSAVDYTAVSAPAVLGEDEFESWMVVESWLSPPLASYSYAIIACRWDTNIGVVYTLSYRSGGV